MKMISFLTPRPVVGKEKSVLVWNNSGVIRHNYGKDNRREMKAKDVNKVKNR
jgi:hypothetical protein